MPTLQTGEKREQQAHNKAFNTMYDTQKAPNKWSLRVILSKHFLQSPKHINWYYQSLSLKYSCASTSRPPRLARMSDGRC